MVSPQCRVQTVTRRGAALFMLMSVVWGRPYLPIKVAVGPSRRAPGELARSDAFLRLNITTP